MQSTSPLCAFPQVSTSECLQIKFLLSVSHKITGATAILLFYTWLPDKMLRIKPNKGVSLRLYRC